MRSTYGMDTPSGSFVLIMSMLMLSFLGMMLLSGQAPTSLGEERVRGSLDVLMATPISTRAIVWGKWLGTYRIVLWLAMIPALAAAIMVCVAPHGTDATADARHRHVRPHDPGRHRIDCRRSRWSIAELLSYGAAITSLGLLLATWIPSARPRDRHQRRRLRPDRRRLAVRLRHVHLASAPGMAQRKPNLQVGDVNWLARGTVVFSPLIGPAITLDGLTESPGGPRVEVQPRRDGVLPAGLGVRRGDVLDGTAIVRPLPGAMRETSQGDGADVPPRLVPVGTGCQNGVGDAEVPPHEPALLLR